MLYIKQYIKHTKNNIRHSKIFLGYKKIFLFLVTCVFMVSLGCNSKNDNTYIYNTNYIQSQIGSIISVDLNNDGIMESVSYVLNKSDNTFKSSVLSFLVSDMDYKDILCGESGELDVYMTNPSKQWYYIVDIDETDNFKEIAITDDGPSADPKTYFFRYDKNELKYIGSIPDYPNSETCIFNGDGTIVSKSMLNILQTWSAPATWKIDKNDFLVKSDEDIYYPYSSNSLNQKLIRDIFIYNKPDLSSDRKIVLAKSSITFVSTDNKHWVSIKTDDGLEGWFYIEDYNIIIEDESIDVKLIFDSLNFAG